MDLSPRGVKKRTRSPVDTHGGPGPLMGSKSMIGAIVALWAWVVFLDDGFELRAIDVGINLSRTNVAMAKEFLNNP